MYLRVYYQQSNGTMIDTLYECTRYTVQRVKAGDEKKPSHFGGVSGLRIETYTRDERCFEIDLCEDLHPAAGLYAMNDLGQTIDHVGWDNQRH